MTRREKTKQKSIQILEEVVVCLNSMERSIIKTRHGKDFLILSFAIVLLAGPINQEDTIYLKYEGRMYTLLILKITAKENCFTLRCLVKAQRMLGD